MFVYPSLSLDGFVACITINAAMMWKWSVTTEPVLLNYNSLYCWYMLTHTVMKVKYLALLQCCFAIRERADGPSLRFPRDCALQVHEQIRTRRARADDCKNCARGPTNEKKYLLTYLNKTLKKLCIQLKM